MKCSWIEVVAILGLLTVAPVVATRRAALSPTSTGPPISRHVLGALLALGLLGIVTLLSLRCGSLEITASTAWNALFAYDSSDPGQIVVRELRLPAQSSEQLQEQASPLLAL